MRAFLLSFVVPLSLSLCVFGCGGSSTHLSKAYSCDMTTGGVHECSVFSYSSSVSTSTFNQIKATCTGTVGTTCATTSLLGSCTYTQTTSGASASVTEYFYSGSSMTAAAAQTACTASSGHWTAGSGGTSSTDGGTSSNPDSATSSSGCPSTEQCCDIFGDQSAYGCLGSSGGSTCAAAGSGTTVATGGTGSDCTGVTNPVCYPLTDSTGAVTGGGCMTVSGTSFAQPTGAQDCTTSQTCTVTTQTCVGGFGSGGSTAYCLAPCAPPTCPANTVTVAFGTTTVQWACVQGCTH